MRAPVLLELSRNLLDQSYHLQHVSDTQHPGDLTVERKDVGFVDLTGDGVQFMKRLQVLNVGDAEVRLTKLDLCLAQHVFSRCSTGARCIIWARRISRVTCMSGWMTIHGRKTTTPIAPSQMPGKSSMPR